MLHIWPEDYHEFGTGSFPGKGKFKFSPEQAKIHGLEKKLKETELERDILKREFTATEPAQA
ncbi:transposase [Flavobacterium sp. 3-210]